MSYIFDIEEFPVIYGRYPIPKGTILYLDSRSNYTFKKTNKIFKTKKEIYLYDYRYVKKILLDLFTYCKRDMGGVCERLALCYGVCSLERQLELVKEHYPQEKSTYKSLLQYYNSSNSLLEPQGVIVAEKNNDMIVSYLLKYMLCHMVDGIVTNKLYSLDEKTIHNIKIQLFDENLVELIEDIQIPKTLDWKYWLDYYNEAHYRGGNNKDYFINIDSPYIFNIQNTADYAKEIISKIVNHISLVPFTPKYTALDISPWPKHL